MKVRKPVLQVWDRYVVTGALLSILVTVFSFTVFEPTKAVVCCFLGWTMLAISIIDARHYIIPDLLSLPAIPIGIALSPIGFDGETSALILEHTASAGAGFLMLYMLAWAYRRVRQVDGLGAGDMKLAAVGGAWTGWEGLAHIFMISTASALVFILFISAVGRERMNLQSRLPFGLFLAPSIWLVWSVLVHYSTSPA